MGRSLFERIADFINGTTPQPQSAESATETTASPIKDSLGDNSIESSENLKDLIISKLRGAYRGQQYITFTNKVLTISICNKLHYDLISSKTFTADLIDKIDSELGYRFAEVEVEFGFSVRKELYNEISSYAYMRIGDIQTPAISAKITVLADCGSLLKRQYTLDIRERKRYNIGVGQRVRLAGGDCRDNHIAIDDSSESPQYDKNKFVSRSHAHISCFEKQGFLLYVEHSGTRQMGKRTRVLRDGSYIELDNVLIPVSLCDGDIIELSKTVMLLYQAVI